MKKIPNKNSYSLKAPTFEMVVLPPDENLGTNWSPLIAALALLDFEAFAANVDDDVGDVDTAGDVK